MKKSTRLARSKVLSRIDISGTTGRAVFSSLKKEGVQHSDIHGALLSLTSEKVIMRTGGKIAPGPNFPERIKNEVVMTSKVTSRKPRLARKNLVPVFVDVLKNPKASEEARKVAEQEILALGRR